MRKFAFSILVGLIVLFSGCTKTAVEEKPNLLFIITDQQRYNTLGMVGEFPFLKTSNLDKLISQGATYERTYTQCAIYAPTRATLMAGRTVENHEVYTNYYDNKKHTEMKSFDEILVETGYYTKTHGKFHLPKLMSRCYEQITTNDDYGPYLDKVFPAVAAKTCERIDNTYKRLYHKDPIDSLYEKDSDAKLLDRAGNPIQIIQPGQHGELLVPSGFSFSSFQIQNTIVAIKRTKKSEKPFSITYSRHLPHSPILPTKPYYGICPVDKMPVEKSINDYMTNSPYTHTNDKIFKPEYADSLKIKYTTSNYFGSVTEIDDWMGKLFEALKENGLKENTLVIFTSDHEEMLGANGMREKNVYYEESNRIPLNMKFPKQIKTGVKVNNPLSNLYATILDYLDVEGDASDSNSLRPLNDGEKTDKFNIVVTEWNNNLKDNEPDYMIVKAEWKLFISYSPTSKVINASYDLKNDPKEVNNLIGKNPNKTKHLEKENKLKENPLAWLLDKKLIHYKGVKERIL